MLLIPVTFSGALLPSLNLWGGELPPPALVLYACIITRLTNLGFVQFFDFTAIAWGKGHDFVFKTKPIDTGGARLFQVVRVF